MATRSAYWELPCDSFDFVNDRVSSMSKNVDFPLVLQCFFKVSHSARKGNGPTNMPSGTRFERHIEAHVLKTISFVMVFSMSQNTPVEPTCHPKPVLGGPIAQNHLFCNVFSAPPESPTHFGKVQVECR